MTPEQLKASILQYAIQGKLVEQRPEEGPADALLEEIRKEKEQLIADGKAKSSKKLAPISDIEKPFDIPDSWKWVYLQDVSTINGGYAFKSTDYTTEGTRVIRISDFNEEGFVDNKIVRHPYKEEFEPFLLNEKDILLYNCINTNLQLYCISIFQFEFIMQYTKYLCQIRSFLF